MLQLLIDQNIYYWLNDLIVQSLENRVSILEEEGAGKPKGPEPLLTCVQCNAEYKESENAGEY